MKELPVKDLIIGKSQARTRDVGKGIDELADSIRKVGLLEPIVVCPSDQLGKYEILTGQRRFLACLEIGADTILSAIMDERVDETTAKIISVTENLIRRDLNKRDLIDACTALFKKYGTIKDVCEETGLPFSKVGDYVKYDRLIPRLRELVDDGDVELKTALRAQDAVALSGKIVVEKAVHLAKEMSGMIGIQQEKVAEKIKESPDRGLIDVIESAKTGEKITQIAVTISITVHRSLQSYAKAEGTNQDYAAASLIEEGLSTKGYLEE